METNTGTVLQTNSPVNLRRAADLMEKVNTLQAEINSLLAGKVVAAATKNGGTRTFSAESRAKIALGQKRRWDKKHAEQAALEAAKAAGAPAPATPAPAANAKSAPAATPVPSGTPVGATSAKAGAV